MNGDPGNAAKDVMQVLAIFSMIVMFSIILHKGYAGISALARQYSGEEFWLRLARYLIANLAGG